MPTGAESKIVRKGASSPFHADRGLGTFGFTEPPETLFQIGDELRFRLVRVCHVPARLGGIVAQDVRSDALLP